MDCNTQCFPVHHQLGKLTQTHVHRVNDAIQPSHPLLSPSPPTSIIPSIGVFSNESVLPIRWPKYWSFSFNISPSNEYSGLISFRMDQLDLLAVQGTLKSLLQHHSSTHQFFSAQLSFTADQTIPYSWDLLLPQPCEVGTIQQGSGYLSSNTGFSLPPHSSTPVCLVSQNTLFLALPALPTET